MSDLRCSDCHRGARVAFFHWTEPHCKVKHVQWATGTSTNAQHGVARCPEHTSESNESMGGECHYIALWLWIFRLNFHTYRHFNAFESIVKGVWGENCVRESLRRRRMPTWRVNHVRFVMVVSSERKRKLHSILRIVWERYEIFKS